MDRFRLLPSWVMTEAHASSKNAKLLRSEQFLQCTFRKQLDPINVERDAHLRRLARACRHLETLILRFYDAATTDRRHVCKRPKRQWSRELNGMRLVKNAAINTKKRSTSSLFGTIHQRSIQDIRYDERAQASNVVHSVESQESQNASVFTTNTSVDDALHHLIVFIFIKSRYLSLIS